VYSEGVVSKIDIRQALEEQKIADLMVDDLNVLLKYMDKSNKGFISVDYFLSKIQELSVETKTDTMLRRFSSIIKH
jgi:hypothetical protein